MGHEQQFRQILKAGVKRWTGMRAYGTTALFEDEMRARGIWGHFDGSHVGEVRTERALFA